MKSFADAKEKLKVGCKIRSNLNVVETLKDEYIGIIEVAELSEHSLRLHLRRYDIGSKLGTGYNGAWLVIINNENFQHIQISEPRDWDD